MPIMSPSSRGLWPRRAANDGKKSQDQHQGRSNKTEGSMSPRSITPERACRGSFSSVREHGSGVTQSFTSSKVSSYAKDIHDDAVSVSSTVDVEMPDGEHLPPLTQPGSRLHGAWYPVATFKGWKQIPLGGRSRHASKSFSDLQGINPFRIPRGDTAPANVPVAAPGTSTLEMLPTEILSAIVSLLVVDTPSNGITKRNGDLRALLLTSKTMHSVSLSILYRKVTIPHSRIFRKFSTQISQNPDLGTLVRRLDFNHFNRDLMGFSEADRANTHNLTGDTLEACLGLTPNLREFLAQEHVGENLERGVLHKLFFELPMLEAVDFCACTHADFRKGFESLLLDFGPDMINISRLSFHKTVTLPKAVFETLFPRLARVTHLDVSACKISTAALFSIPTTARITHLNLARCRLPGPAIVKFLTGHPAVKDSLVVLNLGTDATVHEMLDEEDLHQLLPHLPKTLKSLSLRGSKMTSAHIPYLLPLTRHLEELAVGCAITVPDIHALLQTDKELGPHSLRFLDVSDFQFSQGTDRLFDSRFDILKDSSFPLQVIEISEHPYMRLKKTTSVGRRGWVFKETGQRYWMVRDSPTVPKEDPYREWKMGAESWGSRKIPVAVDEVGGWFGYQMFAKK